jgi:hypothetical protein
MYSLSLRNALACHVVITRQAGKWEEKKYLLPYLFKSEQEELPADGKNNRQISKALGPTKEKIKPLSAEGSKSAQCEVL